MRRRLFTLGSAVSLVLCVATLTTWAWRARGGYDPGHVFPADPPEDGHFVRLDPGRLIVLRPPTPGPQDAAARANLAAFRSFSLGLTDPGSDGPASTVPGSVRLIEMIEFQSFIHLWRQPGRVVCDRPLLDTLDDPVRFLAAHIALAKLHGDGVRVTDALARGDDGRGNPLTVTATVNGVRVSRVQLCEFEPLILLDPDQVRATRARWYGRLGRPVVAVRYAHLAAGAAVLPVVWVGLRLAWHRRTRRWLRAGHCPACGYDLRATPDRCPECGAVLAGAGA